MKNLKKVLLAFVVVAMLVSSIVTIAIANESEPDYADIVAALKNADGRVDAIFSNSVDGVSYYDYLAIQQEFAKFLDEVDTLGYTELNPNPKLYTGNILAAQAKLDKVRSNASLDGLKTGLAEVYTYLRATPVNPITDEFADFLASYYEKCGLLVNAFSEELDKAETVEEQIDILTAMTVYLRETPLSEAVVDYYNTKRAEIVAEYDGFAGEFEGFAALEAIEAPQLVGDLTDLTDLITVLEEIEEPADGEEQTGGNAGGEPVQDGGSGEPELSYIVQKIGAFVAVYNYLAENEINPATEGYAELIVRYNAEKELIFDLLAKGVTETANIEEKAMGIVLYGSFLAEYPISEAAIAEYNTLKAEIVELFDNFSAALDQLVLPTYTPKAEPYVSTNVGMLNYMLSNITGELEAQKAAMSAMYKYLLAVEIDTEEEGYGAFVDAYNAKREELTAALFTTIDAAADEAKVAAYEAVKAYLVETPYSYNAVVAFNEKVAAAYPGDENKANREQLTIGNEYIYFALADAFDFFDAEEEPAIEDILAAIKVVYEYSLLSYDITEDPYYIYIVTPGVGDEPDDVFALTFSEYFDELFAMMGWYLNNYAEEALMNTEFEKVSLICEFYKKVPFSQAAIEEFGEITSEFAQMLAEAAGSAEEELPKPSYIYNELNILVEAFNEAEGLDNRIEAFKALYNAKATVDGALITSAEADGAAFLAAYDEICDKMADEIVASIIADYAVAPGVQIASFEKAYSFLVEYRFRNEAVVGYNAKLELVKTIVYTELTASIAVHLPALEYKSPETTESDFSKGDEKGLADYIGAAANSDAEFVEAYEYFGGNYKKAKAYDFAKIDFAMLVFEFMDAKEARANVYAAAIDEAELNEKPAALDAMYKFIKKNCISYSMVNAYADKVSDVKDAYAEEFTKAYVPFCEAVASIHSYLAEAAIDPALLKEADLAVYNDMQLKLDALEYAEICGKIIDFKTAKGEGDYQFIVQNQKADALTAYYKAYEATENYSEYAFANALFAQAAEDFINLYANIIDDIGGDEAAMVQMLKEYIEENMFCKIMADLFNATFAAEEGDEKIDYDRVDYLPNEAKGTLAEYTDLIKAYFNVDELTIEEDFEAKLQVLESIFAYLDENPLDPTNSATVLFEDVKAALNELEALTDEQKKKADEETPEFEYELTDGRVQFNFEDDVLPDFTVHSSFKKEIAEETRADGTTNKYLLLTSGASTWRGIAMPTVSASVGTVYEFDIMLIAGEPIMDFDIRPQGTTPVSTKTAYMKNEFIGGKFDANKFKAYDPDHPADAKITLTQGEWTHFIVYLNPIDYEMTLYVDYVKIGTVPMIDEETANPRNQFITPASLNVLFGQKNQVIAMDNFDRYAGTSFRLHDKFEGMGEGDMFKYYVNTVTNKDFEPNSRATAYIKAAEMVDTYRDVAGYEAYVNAFDNFDYDTIFPAEEKQQKLETLIGMVEASGAYNVNSTNYTDIGMKLSEIESYIVRYSNYLDSLSPEFNAVKAAINEAYSDVERVKQLLKLVDALELFLRAETVSGMTRRFAEMAVEYEKCNFFDIVNYDKANDDPAVKEYLAAFGEDVTLDMLYNEIIPEIIAARTTYENAGKIVTSVEKIKGLVENADGLSEDAFLAALMAAVAAEENFDYANAYITVIRNIIKSGDYDKDYEGVDAAIKVFDYLNNYFWSVEIDAAVEIIGAQLDKYNLTTSYIDKLGVCTYLRKYIDENAIDVNDAEVAPLYAKLLMYENELQSYEAQYNSILQSNTVAFIATVEKMSAFTEYKDIKPLYDEALNNYYYNMNLDSDAAKAAMATFEAYALIVNATEENSKLFVEAAGRLSAATKIKTIYKTLVECAAYVDGVDSSINGVAEALEVYNAKLSAYNAKINPVNTEIEGTVNVVYSVRAISVDPIVLATVKKIINK